MCHDGLCCDFVLPTQAEVWLCGLRTVGYIHAMNYSVTLLLYKQVYLTLVYLGFKTSK